MLGICVGLNAYIGEGNGTPLHYSCLDNPMEGEAWWAAVHGGREDDDDLRRRDADPREE